MLDGFVLLSTAAFFLAGAVVGARLLLLSARTRKLTDFLVGAALFVITALGIPLNLLANLGDLTIESARLAFCLSALARSLGWTCVLWFTLRVFRPEGGWARMLAVGTVVLIAWGCFEVARFALAAPDLAVLRSPAGPIRWLQAAAIVAFGWTSLEGFLAWQQARLRLRLGLSDPLVVNRMLLWGLFGAFALLSASPIVLITFSGGVAASHAPARLGIAFGGLACAVSMQLAFLPPASYRRWVAGAEAA